MFNPITAFISPGGGELLVIMLVLILLFGAKDAPRMLRTIQTVFDKMQRASADFRYKMMHSDLYPPAIDEPPCLDEPSGSDGPEAGHPETPPSSEPHEKSVS